MEHDAAKGRHRLYSIDFFPRYLHNHSSVTRWEGAVLRAHLDISLEGATAWCFAREAHDKALHSSSKASQSPQSGGAELLAVRQYSTSGTLLRYAKMQWRRLGSATPLVAAVTVLWY